MKDLLIYGKNSLIQKEMLERLWFKVIKNVRFWNFESK
jgi:hypothetical protein